MPIAPSLSTRNTGWQLLIAGRLYIDINDRDIRADKTRLSNRLLQDAALVNAIQNLGVPLLELFTCVVNRPDDIRKAAVFRKTSGKRGSVCVIPSVGHC